ncbi:hypothetical protein [Prescottella subtropica]|uniref:hypothetical protein n=1 Tax=Prescottella subtropica TaxID=2545757 RepID=UPI0010F642C3|nr:hypothetical protein [Prescottella subtropica]
MKLRHLIAVVPAALLVLTGCSNSEEAAAPASTSPSAGQPAQDMSSDDLLDSAVSAMCTQVLTYLDVSEEQAKSSGESFDRAAAGTEFLDQLKSSSGVWVAAYNQQAEAVGQPALDPATATWEDMPAESRELIEKAVSTGVSGTC